MATGIFAKRIAGIEKLGKETVDEAFTAGLLHDLGRVILAFNLPQEYGEAMACSQQDESILCEAEKRIFGSAHAEVGAYLMGLWGLPDTIVESIAFHHWPSGSSQEDFCLLSAVHVADALESECCCDSGKKMLAKFHTDYLAEIGMETKIANWREACQNLNLGATSP